MPEDNNNYWAQKLKRNKERDQENRAILERLGWTVIVIWECELSRVMKDETLARLGQILDALM
jgi:DNA mismatch endonuclease (patch repair protein)